MGPALNVFWFCGVTVNCSTGVVLGVAIFNEKKGAVDPVVVTDVTVPGTGGPLTPCH
jgi:hypothetical protein